MSQKVLGDGLSREVFPLGESRETKLNTPSPQVQALPFYNLLPRDHIELLKVRLYIRKRCLRDEEFRRSIVEMCRADVCFFASVFACVFEPRPPRMIPIRLWTDQADLLAWLAECFGKRDIGVEKSRGLGASWTGMILLTWAWLFQPGCKMAVIYRDETAVDGPDSNSLLGEVAVLIEHLPAWMRYTSDGRPILKRRMEDHSLTNIVNGATIQGYPCVDQKLRGYRFTAAWFDEFAFWDGDVQAALNSSVHVAPCRMFVSTWNGHNNAFYDIVRRNKSSLLRVVYYWWNNEARYGGAYTTEHGRVRVLDTGYKFPPDYPFVTDGLLRSVWVDAELRRAGSSVQSALEELYGLQAEHGRKLFRSDTIQLVESSVRAPDREGYVRRKERTTEFRDERGGPVKIWGRHTGTPQGGPYSAGCDLAAGRGQAYSTCEVIDLTTGEQVAEFACKQIDVVSFAQAVFDLLTWLCTTKGHGHAYLTYENNGELGNAFGEELLRLGYGNIMRRQYRFEPPEGKSHYYGLRNKDGGFKNFMELERAIRDGEVIVRSDAVAVEMNLYDKDEDAKGKVRPAFPYREDGHGDRTMGLGMAWFQARDRMLRGESAPDLPLSGGLPSDHRALFWELYEPQRVRAHHSQGWRLN